MSLTKRQVANLQGTIENVKMNADHASRITLAIWEEWTRKGMSQEEVDTVVELLTDAKIQADMALEMLEGQP
jgi:predicted nucleotidyltransferase